MLVAVDKGGRQMALPLPSCDNLHGDDNGVCPVGPGWVQGREDTISQGGASANAMCLEIMPGHISNSLEDRQVGVRVLHLDAPLSEDQSRGLDNVLISPVPKYKVVNAIHVQILLCMYIYMYIECKHMQPVYL